MQSLNDFNLIDLLYAIEKGMWCRIKYSHRIKDLETELFCYPLEIRVSNMRGREFLMYYEPFRRSYSALRLEFIDSDIANARQALKYSWGVSTTVIMEENAVCTSL